MGRFPVPFDSYTFQAFAFAIDPATNRSVDIARFTVPSSPDGFTLCSHEMEIKEKLTIDAENGPTTVEIRSRMLTIVIRYSTLALTLTACMFAATWASTLASLYIAYSAMTRGRVTWAAFMLHGAMVLVIPTIRKLYLCPLPFGVFLGAVWHVAWSKNSRLALPYRFWGLLLTACHSLHLLRRTVVHPLGVTEGGRGVVSCYTEGMVQFCPLDTSLTWS